MPETKMNSAHRLGQKSGHGVGTATQAYRPGASLRTQPRMLLWQENIPETTRSGWAMALRYEYRVILASYAKKCLTRSVFPSFGMITVRVR